MDHIANMLVSIKNASNVYKSDTKVPHNSLCEKIVEILVKHGYCDSYEVLDIGNNKKQIKINLKYTIDGKSCIKTLRKVSKQSLRCYKKTSEIKDIKNGMGLLIVSTNKGLVTGREAKRLNVGGEVLVVVDE